MITTLIILALSAVFFVNGKLRSDLVVLCALVLLIVFNILTPEEALSGFSNPNRHHDGHRFYRGIRQ